MATKVSNLQSLLIQWCCFLVASLTPTWVCSDIESNLSIAAASNFILPIKELIKTYESKTTTRIKLSVGSSGSLHAQIVNGAPFQLFFSADQDKPESLISANLADETYRYTYAIGRLVLWSAQKDSQPEMVLLSGSFKKIALANPELAPYGKAAISVLENLGLNEQYANRQVQGQNIAQTYLYTLSGNAQLGFIAASQNQTKIGAAWDIPKDLYQPIKQDVVLINKYRRSQPALGFLKFVKSDRAKSIILKYGYDVTKTN